MSQTPPPNEPRAPSDRHQTSSWGDASAAPGVVPGESPPAAPREAVVGRPQTLEGMPSLRRVSASLEAVAVEGIGVRGDRARMAIVGLLLFECACLPTRLAEVVEAPWVAWLRPGTAGFVALTFLVGLLATSSLPLRRPWRHGLRLVFGLGLVAVVGLLGEGAIIRQSFDGQPVMGLLLAGPMAPRLILGAAVVGLVAGLTWRQHTPKGKGPTLVCGTAIAMIAVCYLGLHHVGLGENSAVAMLVGPGPESAFLGDRIAVWLAWAPAVVSALALGACVWGGPRLAGMFAMAFWLSVSVPLVVLALFVAPLSAWPDALTPLKVTTLLCASLLLLGSACGGWLGALSASSSRVPGP